MVANVCFRIGLVLVSLTKCVCVCVCVCMCVCVCVCVTPTAAQGRVTSPWCGGETGGGSPPG